MTYVSRRTRIIISRWLDECDANYRLQVSRKRSDGRLKKYSSCDDFRAWVNDNCIKHEYLTDLMSNAEFPGHPPFRLFGRFIPVPVLFQLAQGSKATEVNQSTEGQTVSRNAAARRSKSETSGGVQGGKQGDIKNADKNGNVGKDGLKTACQTDNRYSRDVPKVQSNSNLIRAQWEQNLLEKSLLDCTSLLDKAMKKLEKIDCIVAQVNEEFEKEGIGEINVCFSKCSHSGIESSCDTMVYSSFQKAKEAAKCSELLRRISDLREKLKRIQECKREVNHQIIHSTRKIECTSSAQVTELYSRRESHIKKLRKKLEKLIAEKGRLLSEMCEALTSLNNIKKSSRSTMNFPRGDARAARNWSDSESGKFAESVVCHCGCECSDNFPESEEYHCSETLSSDSEDNNCWEKSQKTKDFYLKYQVPCDESVNARKKSSDFDNNCAKYAKEYRQIDEKAVNRTTPERTYNKYQRLCPNLDDNNKALSSNLKQCQQLDRKSSKVEKGEEKYLDAKQEKTQEAKQGKTREGKKGKAQETKQEKAQEAKQEKAQEANQGKKTRVKFVCAEPPCRKRLEADDISAYENTLTQEQLCVVSEAVENIRNSRPNTPVTGTNTTQAESQRGTPTGTQNTTTAATRRGRQSVSLERNLQGQNSGGRSNCGCIPERRAKSETTMKEIEKTLRNYQRRLCELDNLECKVEQMKEKVSESNYLKKNLARMKAEVKKLREAEREKSEREISRLCSENWELKRQIQELAAKFSSQSKKIQNLKCGVRRARELECQAEDMKKELSEYKDSFEHQRKCISKWESVVLVQRTEIENLMNHIRMLTTQLNEEEGACKEKKSMQRSRSYSPEVTKGKKPTSRPKTHVREYRRGQEEDEEQEGGGCICGSMYPDNRYPDSGGKPPPNNFQEGCYTKQWCN